jgi:hypothetical protein
VAPDCQSRYPDWPFSGALPNRWFSSRVDFAVDSG